MITINEYEEAKKVIKDYESQQIINEEKIKEGDINLFDVLSTRIKNCLLQHNKNCKLYPSWYRDAGDEIIFASDAAKFIKKTGDKYAFLKLRNMGHKSHRELMVCIKPYL
jgi:hypothetical protein